MTKKYFLPQKAELKQLKITDISLPKPDLKNIYESKTVAIGKWLIAWIDKDLKSNKIKHNELLPSKSDFAYYLGVSIGTIQNAFRYIEDLGWIESKQCIGTLVKDKNSSTSNIRKLTSKREKAIEAIKKYIWENNYKCGQILPSSRLIADRINSSPNTTRLALEYLGTQGILEHKFKKSNEAGWVVQKSDFEFQNYSSDNISGTTLVEKVEEELKEFISQNLKIGDKLPAHSELSKILKVSIKTVHDALSHLIDNGILLARRGRYGTTVIKMPYSNNIDVKKETSIFAPAKDTAFYYYEKTQNHIKKMIAEKYQIGEKLPSIVELSKELDISPNTIRKAFGNLAKEGYLAFSRGRYGGTFVLDIPEMEEHAFKWLAVNPKFAELYKN